MATPSIRSPSEQDSVAALVARLSDDVRRIVRAELALPRARFMGALSAVRSASFPLALGVVLALAGVGALVASLLMALTIWLVPWLAALVVGVGLLAVAAGLLAFEVRAVTGTVIEVLAPEEELVSGDGRHGE